MKGLILGPFLVLIYINNLVVGLTLKANFLLMILRFSRWFMTQVLHQSVLMTTCPKYRNGQTNVRCNLICLILILQNKPKRLFSHAKNPSKHSGTNFSNMSLKGTILKNIFSYN